MITPTQIAAILVILSLAVIAIVVVLNLFQERKSNSGDFARDGNGQSHSHYTYFQ